MTFSKWSCTIIAFSVWLRAQPASLRSRWMKFFLRLPLARRWKNLVLASPSLM
jgi:hypothetical protein